MKHSTQAIHTRILLALSRGETLSVQTLFIRSGGTTVEATRRAITRLVTAGLVVHGEARGTYKAAPRGQ